MADPCHPDKSGHDSRRMAMSNSRNAGAVSSFYTRKLVVSETNVAVMSWASATTYAWQLYLTSRFQRGPSSSRCTRRGSQRFVSFDSSSWRCELFPHFVWPSGVYSDTSASLCSVSFKDVCKKAIKSIFQRLESGCGGVSRSDCKLPPMKLAKFPCDLLFPAKILRPYLQWEPCPCKYSQSPVYL